MVRRPKIAKARGRSVTEWVGKSPDAMPPPTVRQRIFDRFNGVCQLSGMAIGRKKWECHHKVRVEDGGPNTESNFIPVLKTEHDKLSRMQLQAQREADRKRRADTGAKGPPERPLQSRNDLRHSEDPRRPASDPAKPGSKLAALQALRGHGGIRPK